MKVSVIILTFNSEAILEATLSAAAKVSDDIHIVELLKYRSNAGNSKILWHICGPEAFRQLWRAEKLGD